jgi:hypothetical protein
MIRVLLNLEGGSEISSAESTIIEAKVSQLKTQHRSKPSMPLVGVTLSFFNFCSFAYTDLNAYSKFRLTKVPGHG